jgi:hypothetical protein
VPAIPRIEVPSGIINGSNRVFYTSVAYRPGTVQVFLNGQLKEGLLDDGWFELGTNKVRLKEAPRTEDVIQIYYIPV